MGHGLFADILRYPRTPEKPMYRLLSLWHKRKEHILQGLPANSHKTSTHTTTDFACCSQTPFVSFGALPESLAKWNHGLSIFIWTMRKSIIKCKTQIFPWRPYAKQHQVRHRLVLTEIASAQYRYEIAKLEGHEDIFWQPYK